MHQMHQDSLTVYCEAWCISIILFARLKIASIFVCSEPFCILFLFISRPSPYFCPLVIADLTRNLLIAAPLIPFPTRHSSRSYPFRHCGFDPQSPDRSLQPLAAVPQSPGNSPQASNPLFESKSTPNAPNRTNLPLWSKKVSPVYSQAFSYLAPNLPFPLKRKLWIYLDGIVKGCTFALAFKDSGSTKESS